jgi:predicted glycoside hydrolase/deacetylase ChbG (UPF0249 family)
MTEKRLIVNADDFGMSRGVTDAVILAHRYGFLTSTSLMVNMPAAEYAVQRLARVPGLGVGIHLNICAGRPVLPAPEIPSLVGADGNFHSPASMIRKLWTWRVSPREIEAEFRAQIRWMKDRGITPTHADSHHHMHIYPAAVGPFVRALMAEGIRCARAPRSSVWPRTRELGGPHEGGLLRRVCVQAYRAALQHIAFRKFDMPASRISFLSRDRHDLGSLGEQWKLAFANLPPGTFELACHPGLFERGFSEADRIRNQREEELHWLTDREWRGALDRSGIRLITYRELSPQFIAQTAGREAHALQ